MATLDFTAIGRDRGASRMLQNLGRESDKTHSKMSHLNSGMGKLGKVGAAGGAAAAAGLALGAGAAIKFGLDTAMANERAKIGFTTMLGSAKKADVFLRQLQQFAAKTPFEFPELQKAASGLVAVGVETKNIIPIMKTVGNVTSGMGTGSEGVQRAVLALQQMSAAGRISAEDLNQLRDAGLSTNIVFDAISQKTGISTKKLYEMRDAGKLGKKELDALMESLASGKGFEKFNGLMDKQSQSLEGMLSTLKDTFGQGMAEALQAGMPFIKAAIGGLTKGVGNFFDWVQTHQEDFVMAIVQSGNAVLGLAKTFVELEVSGLRALGALAGALGEFLRALSKVPHFGKQFEAGADAMENLGTTAIETADQMEAKLIPAIDEAHAEWNKFGSDQRTKARLRDANQVIQNALSKTDESIKKNGRNLDTHTRKGQLNRDALKRLADANKAYIVELQRTGSKTEKVDRATDNARSSFIKTARSMGASKREAEQLADKYGLLDRRINNLNSKTIRLTTNYRATASKAFANFISNVPAGPNRSGFSQLPRGGPRRGASLDSMIGAPVPTPGPEQGGPSVTNIRHASPGMSNALRQPGQFQNTAFTAGRYISQKGSNWLADKGADYANSMGAMGPGPGGSVAPYSATMAGTIAAMRRAGARNFTTYPGHGNGEPARDVTPHSWKIANVARASRSVWYVIYRMRIASKNHGNTWRQFHPSSHRGDWQHVRHVHVSWFDRGGMLKPGLNLAYNGTGKNEHLRPVGSSSSGTSITYIINAPNYVGSQADLAKAVLKLAERGQLTRAVHLAAGK